MTALEQRPPPQAGQPTPAPDLAPLEQAPDRTGATAAAEPRAARSAARRPGDRQPGHAVEPAPAGSTRTKRRLAASEKAARRIAQVQAAAMALDAGQKLGDLPGAPPALARFADAAPPTEAALRLAFPTGRARGAGGLASGHRRPAAADASVGPGAGPRHHPPGRPRAGRRPGRRRAGACPCRSRGRRPGRRRRRRLPRCEGAAAQAMAAWLAQARSLLEARAALAAWAASG